MPTTPPRIRRLSAASTRRETREPGLLLAAPTEPRPRVVRRRATWLLLAAMLFAGAAAAVAVAQPSADSPNPCLQPGPRPPHCLPDPSHTGRPLYPSGTPLVPDGVDPCAGPQPRPVPCAPSRTPIPAATSVVSPCPTGVPGRCVSPPTTGTVPPTVAMPSTPPNVSGGECGITDVGACVTDGINSFFWALVVAALNSLLRVLGQTLLATPTLDQWPQIGALWESSRGIAVAAYALLIMVAGIVLMAYETLQARTTVRQIAPRIAVGFLAANLSLLLSGKAIELANALSYALVGGGVDPSGAAQTLSALLTNTVLTSINGTGLFGVLIALGLAVLLIALIATYVVRVALTAMLLAGAPLFLICHGLEQIDGIARWWWRAFAGVLAIQLGQSLALITALRVFFAEGGFTIFGPTPDGVINLIATGGLLWILVKIPGWVMHHVQLGGGRRSLLGSLVRAFVAYKTFGLLRGRSSSGGGGPHPSGGRGGNGGGRGPADPYAHTRTTADGQYLLPLAGVRRSRPAAKPKPAPTPQSRAGQGRQLALPLGDDWPENKPVLRRDGQYRLPLNVRRVKPTPPPASPNQPGGRRRGGQQLELPFDPYKGNRPTRSGQYPLPLDGVRRTPRPASPPRPAAPPARRRGTQLELPFDPYKGNRPTRSGQYPLPLDGVRRVPPAPPTSVTPPPRPAPPAGQQLRLPLDLPKPVRRTPPKPPTSGGQP